MEKFLYGSTVDRLRSILGNYIKLKGPDGATIGPVTCLSDCIGGTDNIKCSFAPDTILPPEFENTTIQLMDWGEKWTLLHDADIIRERPEALIGPQIYDIDIELVNLRGALASFTVSTSCTFRAIYLNLPKLLEGKGKIRVESLDTDVESIRLSLNCVGSCGFLTFIHGTTPISLSLLDLTLYDYGIKSNTILALYVEACALPKETTPTWPFDPRDRDVRFCFYSVEIKDHRCESSRFRLLLAIHCKYCDGVRLPDTSEVRLFNNPALSDHLLCDCRNW